MSESIPQILEAFKTVTSSSVDNIWVRKYTPPSSSSLHQFVFFLKPEATCVQEGVNVEVCLRKALTLLEKGVNGKPVHIGAIRVIGGPYLDKLSIMVQHYGVIAKISKEGESAISPQAREVLKTKFAEDIANWSPEHYKSHILGGHQFLAKFPQFNAFSLLALNDNLTITRLGPGTYAIKVKVRGELFIVLNSFHPYQVVPYNAPGNAIIVFECLSELSWEDLRGKLAGPTNPADAPEGTIRHAYLRDKVECGLKDVDRGTNGVHMSAGPLEGMVELVRFFSDFGNLTYGHTVFGSLLSKVPSVKVDALASNPDGQYQGKTASVFDLTEEKDYKEAIEILSNTRL
eukprot:TRINITY_DN2752_c0_g1_i1.p1 TRINITY_DN2752_c0_g1~~TRINITY_DN2752_c0_g1_i1.p1  ORF type:complete len:345 (-),score=71.62 TRINITY_DN2752_c0_g1_i1:126-1160(-)